MGLSDEERYVKILYSVKAITETPLSGHDKIKKLISQLWEAFLPTDSNSGLWLFGGEWDNNHFDQQSLLMIAFDKWQDFYKEKDEEFKLRTNYDFGWLCSDYEVSKIVEISRWLENIFYAVDRYDDKFSKQYADLAKICRKIQIEIFLVVHGNPEFYKTWMLYHIIDKCRDDYGDDFVSQISHQQYWHHDLKLRGHRISHSGEELQAAFLYTQPLSRHKIPIQIRLSLLLALMAGSYHYKHNHRDLIRAIEIHNEKGDDLVNLDEIKKLLEWCQAQKEVEAGFYRYVSYCELTGQRLN